MTVSVRVPAEIRVVAERKKRTSTIVAVLSLGAGDRRVERACREARDRLAGVGRARKATSASPAVVDPFLDPSGEFARQRQIDRLVLVSLLARTQT
jgi:hypothetical protein